MSLLRHDDVLYYHPLDDFKEHIKNHDWDFSQINIAFSGGVVVSGLTNSDASAWSRLLEDLSGGGYTDVDGAERMTTCFWVGVFFQSNGCVDRRCTRHSAGWDSNPTIHTGRSIPAACPLFRAGPFCILTRLRPIPEFSESASRPPCRDIPPLRTRA